MSIGRRLHLQREANAKRRSIIAEIRDDPRFVQGLDRIAREGDLNRERVTADAAKYLHEMVSVHSQAFPDFNLFLSRIADKDSLRNVLQWNQPVVDELRDVNATMPLVMMTAHRSYLDFVVRVPFGRQGFEREFRFAGANIAFWPMGPIGRTVGIIFVRRGFRDPVYSFVMRQYVGYLASERASFLWAIEGGRTRTGKLLPPKAGLLAYLAQAYADGRAPDVALVPGTVVYEYLNEVFEYARYGRGATKRGESMFSFVSFSRQQRNVPKDARINVGLGAPVSLGRFVARGASADELSTGITLAAIEVSRRIDAATPITPVALVLLPLLAGANVSMTADQIAADLAPTLRRLARRGLTVAAPGVGSQRDIERALGLMETQGLIVSTGAGTDRSYRVVPGRHVEVSYYRNSIVHFFAVRSIAELALLRSTSAIDGARVAAFWEEAERLRDLLEHEFFFPEADGFRDAIRSEISADAADWEATLEDPGTGDRALDAMAPFESPRVLAPFLEAHRLVADELRRGGAKAIPDQARFVAACLARGQLDLHVGRVNRPDAVSLHMFETPLTAIKARGLFAADTDVQRNQFADAVDAAVRDVGALEARTHRGLVSEFAR